ncbi:MAG TPA: thioredoxin family protein [Hyphomicrobiaceae bacterium]|jgi:peroxiredoxin|nr:thioredoxin family protein [Hyphomicrobiaceae bacterium]
MFDVCRRDLIALLGAAGLIGLLAAAGAMADPSAQARLGAPAPDFTLTDSNGRSVSLADFKGKTIVLEWTNHDCPYVRKHYGSQNMQALQKKWTAQGVAWLTLISSRPGAQGFVHGLEANKLTADRGAAPTAVLLDPNGSVGRSYGAQVTPHMYVITGDGALAYMGGIDDKPTTRLEDLKTAKNFVDAALGELALGSPVSVKTSRPYGCTIKYSS